MKRSKKFRLAIFASGSGTNAGTVMKHFREHPSMEVSLLMSNNPKAGALDRARTFQVPTKVFDRVQFSESDQVLHWLKEAGITHLVLAGFLWLVPENLLHAYAGRIINIHPALLPKYGGKGMYGRKVHERVIAAGERKTGITIHAVNENFDEGEILFQATCPVEPTDTPESIAEKVHQLEYAHYPGVIEEWVNA